MPKQRDSSFEWKVHFIRSVAVGELSLIGGEDLKATVASDRFFSSASAQKAVSCVFDSNGKAPCGSPVHDCDERSSSSA